ncbi:hypothetical protein CIHG_01081 [Coccidioides immitis H538.4]|uniref:RNA-dependent RNA polymerase n=1 Tax=Coccidioides immitis H538.4 TaxID=396776 RepID=A0A0J8RH20_COCIT|nr:hypothetical protein CIHG_01081 [Coccidioides immitis H538.4]
MSTPYTPRTARGCNQLLLSLSAKYNLDLPTSEKKGTPAQRDRTLGQKCVSGLTYLHFNGGMEHTIAGFEEMANRMLSEWIHKPNQDWGTLPAPTLATQGTRSFINGSMIENSKNISLEQRDELLQCLHKLLEDEIRHRRRSPLPPATVGVGASATALGNKLKDLETSMARTPSYPAPGSPEISPSKRKGPLDRDEVFSTAPSSPIIDPSYPPKSFSLDCEFDDDDLDELLPVISTDVPGEDQCSLRKGKQQRIDSFFKSVRRPLMDASRDSSFNDPFSSTSRIATQTNMNGYMRVSKVSTTNSRHQNNDKSGLLDTFSTMQTGLAHSSFMEGTDTVATSFESNIANVERKPDKAPSQVNDYTSETSTVALLKSADFQEQFAMQLSPEPAMDPADLKMRAFIDTLETSGPFTYSKCGDWPSNIPLRYRYEVERVAHSRGMAIEELLPQYRLPSQDYSEFWEYITQEKSNKKTSLLEKTKPVAWEVAVGNFEESSTKDVVTLTGDLEWCAKSEPGYLKFVLKPLRLERSHRFARRFGSDRFLEITFPALTKSPDYLKNQGPIVLRSIATWLATSSHYLLGRTWRAFYLEDVKAKNKKDGPKSKVHLFAVNGNDFIDAPLSMTVSPAGEMSDKHTPMTVEALFNWHIPVQENKESKDCKIFQRLALGLSRTIPTVVIRPEHIIIHPRHIDIPLEDRGNMKSSQPDMSDGCALMSVSLANRIKDCLGLKEENPSCFQGRIAGAKGIWMVDGRNIAFKGEECIQISGSQLKTKPHPSDCRMMLDDHQLTFEVVSWSKELRPVNLNVQLLMVLQHGGVQTDRLKNLVRCEMNTWYQEFKGIITNEIASRAWVQKQGLYEKRKTRRIDDFPTENVEQAILLLDSGFHPLKSVYLMNRLKTFLDDYCARLDSLKIRIPESTYAYCIADPYNVLAEDEVHLGFSRPWDSEGYTDLDGMDVLVGRNPAHLPSDIQKRRAVFKKELRHFKDVIVFPTAGALPLASMLSGGDYDGDQVWTCWDPQLVNQFTNTPFDPKKIPERKEFGLIDCSEELKANFDFDGFLTKMFVFNAAPSLLGHCTNEHEKLCYYENGIASEGALRLSHLLGYLADVRKSGHELRRETWMRQWNELSKDIGPDALRKPAYKQTREELDCRPNDKSIIDVLKFEVVEEEKNRIKADFSEFCKAHQECRDDPDLLAAWTETWERAIFERDNNKDKTLLNAIQNVKAQVEAVANDRPRRNCGKSFATVISSATDMLRSIKPPEIDHELSYTWRNRDDSWQVFLASCAYRLYPKGDFPWLAAGPTLCEIKARAVGPYRMVTMPVYQTLRVNHRAAKRVQEAASVNREDIDRTLDALDVTYPELQDSDDDEDDSFDDWKSFAT